METPLKIRLAARCEAAGRSENEDNFQVAEDLSKSNTSFTTDKIFTLGNKGTLLLVCDGMGGMNAGEVASAIGVETIKNLFSPSVLTPEILQSDDTISAYIKQAIVKTDAKIKDEAAKDSAKQGMGSTVVLAWLLGTKVYVGWCGDSRAYRFNPNFGLELLSHDHSYVQDLVDTGKLDPNLAFDHPQKNIITRSLGDPRGAARPDVKIYNLRSGDIIMLCSDGLSDSLRDSQIERAMQRSTHSMAACRDALWEDSRMAGWHDNVTIVIGQVVEEKECPTSSTPNPTEPTVDESGQKKPVKKPALFVAITVVALALIGVFVFSGKNDTRLEERDIAVCDSLCKLIPQEIKFDKNKTEVEIINDIDYYCAIYNQIAAKDSQKAQLVKEKINKGIDNVTLLIRAEDENAQNEGMSKRIEKHKIK